MIVTRDLATLPLPEGGGSVVSLGVFDGVHLGHQAILALNRRRAGERGLRPTVVTFAEHPKGVLLGRAPRTLTTLAHRLELFRRAGIEHAVVLVFDEGLRDTPAEDFVDEILLRRLDARSFVLGFDSKFGRDRRGGPELLRALGRAVEVVPKVVVDQRGVSSTVIREAVELGDLEGAARMLGRPVSVLGTVVHGRELGREIGFPTANLDLAHELHPPAGVYACRAHVLTRDESHAIEHSQPAVSNIGFRPTVEGERADEPTIEVHLLDFDGDLYGRSVELEFVLRLRGEERFPGLDALAEQIGRDVARAREVLGARRAGETAKGETADRHGRSASPPR